MGIIYKNGIPYGASGGGGANLPSGGTTGQALVKKSNVDGDVKWADIQGGTPSGWGIAKSGVLQVPITNQRGDIVIPVNDLGLASGNDYNVALTIVGGGTGSWGDALTFLWGKSSTQANGSVMTTGANVDRVDVSYIVVAKGYGSNVSGWGIAKIGYTQVEFSNSAWSGTSTVDISSLGLSANTDYEVFVEHIGGGTLTAWGDSNVYVGNKTKDNFTVGAVKPEAVTGTLSIKYVVFAKGYGSSGGKGDLPSGGTTGQSLVKRSDADGDVEWQTIGGTSSGWGVAKTGLVTLTSTSGSHIPFQIIDITDLGLASVDDYEVLVTLEGNRSTNYKAEEAFADKISATQFEVAFYTSSQEGLTVNVSYAVIAKGYGRSISGWGVAKVGEVTGTFDGDWLQGATVDISSLGFNSVDDYDVYVRGASSGSAQIMPYINSGRTATSFQVAANKNGQSVTEFTASYVVIGRGFGGSSVGSGLPAGGTTGQVLKKISNDDGAVTWGDASSNYDDTELRNMIGDVSQLQTASHVLVGAINELQTGNVFPVVNASKVNNRIAAFVRESANSDTFYLYDLNNYPHQPTIDARVDLRNMVPAGDNSFYLNAEIVFKDKGQNPYDRNDLIVPLMCFMIPDGIATGQRRGTAYAQLNDGRVITGIVHYVPSNGRVYMSKVSVLTSEEEVKRRVVGYNYDVDKHFVAPGLNLLYSGIQEVLPGPQIDLEFWDFENFPADFDVDDPSTWPAPIKVYTGSVLDDNLTFTINGVVGQYNAAQHSLDIDLSTFPEYDPQNENGTLYIHGTMVRKIDSILLPNGGGGSDIQVTALPTASANEEGNIYQYVGATTSSLTNGYFYQCIEVTPATDPKTYEWKQKNVQAGGSGGIEPLILTEGEATAYTKLSTDDAWKTRPVIVKFTSGQKEMAVACSVMLYSGWFSLTGIYCQNQGGKVRQRIYEIHSTHGWRTSDKTMDTNYSGTHENAYLATLEDVDYTRLIVEENGQDYNLAVLVSENFQELMEKYIAVKIANYNGVKGFTIPVSVMQETLGGTTYLTGIIDENIITYTIIVNNYDDNTKIADITWTKTVTPIGGGTVDTTMSNSSENAVQNKVIKTYVDDALANKQDTLVSGTNLKTVNGNSLLGAGNVVVGINFAIDKETWYGTYTDENNVTYQVYTKTIYIPALPSTAGITTYPHNVANIKQILSIYGFTTDGFVLNAPRQNTQDNIAIYQASKSASNRTFSIEVGKDRSNKSAYVTMVYAKNN